MDPGKILWAAPYPAYLQDILFFFQKFQCPFCLRFFFFFVNMEPYGSKKFQNATSPVFSRSEPNFMINKVAMGEYKVTHFWRSVKKFYGTFEIFVNTRPQGAGGFKTLLLLQFLSDLSQTYDK